MIVTFRFVNEKWVRSSIDGNDIVYCFTVCSSEYQKCYTVIEVKDMTLSWNEAVSTCKRFDVMLVNTKSKDEMHFIKTFAGFEIPEEPIFIFIGMCFVKIDC
jgi:hypothetical protein